MERRIDWFFIKTATNILKGKRFKDKDRPTESTMRDLCDSVVFKTEPTHRAKADKGVFDSSSNGHVTIATGIQVKNYEEKKSDRSIAVTTEQVTEVSSSNNSYLSGVDSDVDVTKDETESRRNKFIVRLSESFTNWLNSFKEAFDTFIEEATPKLIPDGGEIGQFLVKESEGYGWSGISDDFLANIEHTVSESLENDVDFVVVLDQTSLGNTIRATITDEMNEWYSRFKAKNPWYVGNIYFHTYGLERWLTWAKLFALDRGINKVMLLSFIDEAESVYHSLTIANIATELPTSTYKDDFNNFIAIHDQFDFFKNIIYAVPVKTENENAMFHAHVYKAVSNGTVTDYIESPTVVSRGSSLSFMETSNSYSTVNNPNSLSGNYSGLELYGVQEFHDFGTSDINNKLTAEEFDDRIQTGLFGEERINVFTINLKATMDSGDEYDSSFEIKIPVSQIDWEGYTNVNHPTSRSEIDNYADGTLYYLTPDEMGLIDTTLMDVDVDKVLFVK